MAIQKVYTLGQLCLRPNNTTVAEIHAISADAQAMQLWSV